MMTIYDSKKPKNTFAKAVREARRAAGFDQESFALLVNVSISTIKKWEAGNCRPTPTNISKMIAVLAGIPEEYKEAIINEYAK